MLHQFARICQDVEEFLRIPGYIPVIGTITGTIRMFLAWAVQGLVSAVTLVVSMVMGVFHTIFGHKGAATKWTRKARLAVNLCVHSSLNSYRGMIELFPVIGGLALYLYDKSLKGSPLFPHPKVK